MRNLIFIMLCSVLSMGTLAQKTFYSDPNAQSRTVANFHAIEVSNAIDLYLSQGDEEACAVSAQDIKSRDHIKTEVINGTLKIWYEKEGWNWNHGHKKLKAYVSFKQIDRLGASGASDVRMNGVLSGTRLDLHLSGASDFSGAVKLDELYIDQSGASDVSIQGIVSKVDIDASGASDVKGYELISDNCSVKASGASDIQISVNKELNAHLSGASSVNYKGSGLIRELHSSGASSVSRKG